MSTALVGTIDERIELVTERIRAAQGELQLVETVARGPGRRDAALAYVAGSSVRIKQARSNADEAARLGEVIEGLVELRIDLEGEWLEEHIASVRASIAAKDRALAELLSKVEDLQRQVQLVVPGALIDLPPNATRDSTSYERTRLGDLQSMRSRLVSSAPVVRAELRARVLRGERPV